MHGPITASPAAGSPSVPAYFRCTPYFRAPEGPHEWMNRSVLVGTGERHLADETTGEPDHTLFRYFLVR